MAGNEIIRKICSRRSFKRLSQNHKSDYSEGSQIWTAPAGDFYSLVPYHVHQICGLAPGLVRAVSRSCECKRKSWWVSHQILRSWKYYQLQKLKLIKFPKLRTENFKSLYEKAEFENIQPDRAEPTVQPDWSIEITRWSCSDLGAPTVWKFFVYGNGYFRSCAAE